MQSWFVFVMPYLKVIVHWKLLDWIVYGIMINDMYVVSTFLLITLLEIFFL